MKRLIPLVVLCAALCGCGKVIPADDEVAVVPLPERVAKGQGTFLLTASTEAVLLSGDDSLACVTGALDQVLEPVFGKGLRVRHADVPLDGALNISCDAAMPADGYRLEITPGRAEIVAGSAAGAFYAVQTLRQLIPAAAYGAANVRAVELPVVTIEDKPCLGYRGMMLDVCRHFFPVEDVKTYIDILSLHKINKFHWHLTDDQGWRIEIKKYPLLTQIGSRRAETLVGRYDKNKEGVYDGKPYGGFYTQEEIREIVSYAAERHIEVIPEIEMPGHGLAALTAYPWLGCTGGPYAVWTHWGISDDVYCAGKETTFEFIEKVLTEVLALFPSKLIHIGGDECPKGRWKACPLCQQRIREEGLKDEYQLQSYFIHRIERWMHTHGREIIGWDEILQGGISKTANIMSWNGSDPGIKAAQRGNPVIMTPKWYCYFDYSQTSDPERYEPLGNTRYVSVRQAYRLDPCDRLTLPDQKRIRGVQCNLWTEYIADIRHAQHMVLPRMAALAETGWANDRKDYNDFVRRIPALVAVYKAEGYNYAPYLFEGIE